jgi:hypothetical protein
MTDFCIWGGPTPGSVIGNVEAVVVAYCTKPGHGTRLIPEGALLAVYVLHFAKCSIFFWLTMKHENSQFIKTPAYIQVTGLINQTFIDLDPNDGGVSSRWCTFFDRPYLIS